MGCQIEDKLVILEANKKNMAKKKQTECTPIQKEFVRNISAPKKKKSISASAHLDAIQLSLF